MSALIENLFFMYIKPVTNTICVKRKRVYCIIPMNVYQNGLKSQTINALFIDKSKKYLRFVFKSAYTIFTQRITMCTPHMERNFYINVATCTRNVRKKYY